MAAIAFIAYAWRYRHDWPSDRALVSKLQPATLAAVCVGGALVVGIGWGTFLAAGPDASGYVSQAAMWRHAELTKPAPAWAVDAPWPDAIWAAAPVGYRAQSGAPRFAPVYPPGLPLTMALFQVVGGETAAYYVVPLLGALAVGATFLLGRSLNGPWCGAVAAVLLISSPPFLWLLTQPMSDVPATAWWALALVLAWSGTPGSTIGAGLATAAAIVVRPNLVPLAAIVGAIAAATGPQRFRRLVFFSLAAAPGALTIGALNWYWHGSPLRSGYGSVDTLYSVSYVWPNLQRYALWIVEAQTPLFLAGFAVPYLLASPFGSRTRTMLLCVGFPLVTFACYAAYLVFDDWQYLRFLLPAYPALCAGLGAAIVWAVERTGRSAIAVGTTVALTSSIAFHGWSMARREGLFDYAVQDERYENAVSYAAGLPAGSVLVSLVYSGTLHYYTGRDILRWEVLTPEALDQALAFLTARGHHLYLIADAREIDDFKRRFAGTRAVQAAERATVFPGDGFVSYELRLEGAASIANR